MKMILAMIKLHMHCLRNILNTKEDHRTVTWHRGGKKMRDACTCGKTFWRRDR